MSGLDLIPKINSNFERLRLKYLKSGALYEDPDFPATTDSIYFNREYSNYTVNQYKWMRPKEICKFYFAEPHFFLDGGSRFDLIQGELGDCWVVAAAACLSEDHRLLERVVPSGQSFNKNWYAGIFCFRFWQYGEWVEVIVDDRLPTVGQQLMFVHSNHRNEFWGALLEKAYAKLHGSYEALRAGTNGDALTDFTGGLVESYFLSEPPANLPHLLLKAFARRSLIGAAIYGDSARNVELPSGLVTGHAYSVTAMKQVTVENQIVNLVRVRNPWGSHVEWKGAWSDRSREWKLLSSDERQRMGLIVRHDGEFWMDLRDFQRNFHGIDICNLTADALVDPPKTWTVSIVHSHWTKGRTAGGRPRYASFSRNPQIRLRVEDSKDDPDDRASFIIELMQKDRRKDKQHGYDNLTIGFVLYKIAPDVVLPLRDEFFRRFRPAGQINSYTNGRSAVQRFTLAAGDYVVIPTTWEPNEEAKFTVRVFSEATHASNRIDDQPEVNDMLDNNGTHSNGTSNEDPTVVSLRKYFDSLAGQDKETDAMELKKCLDYAVSYESYSHLQFKYSTCKYLIIMMDADQSGKLAFPEFLVLWMTLKQWLKTFVNLDRDKNGIIPASELPSAFRSLGYELADQLTRSLIYRYSDGNNRIFFNKYIKCMAKVRMLFNRFRAGPQVEGTLNFNFNQWLKTGSVL